MFEVIEVTKHKIRQPHWSTKIGRMIRPGRSQNHKTRIFFWPEGENVFEQLESRHMRPMQAWRKMVPSVLEQLNVSPNKVTIRWSNKAGCSMCPCSPGFIVDGWDENLSGHDVHVKVSADPMMVR